MMEYGCGECEMLLRASLIRSCPKRTNRPEDLDGVHSLQVNQPTYVRSRMTDGKIVGNIAQCTRYVANPTKGSFIRLSL